MRERSKLFSLGITVIEEGIETINQRDLLRHAGCAPRFRRGARANCK
jgi:hypothetical protein